MGYIKKFILGSVSVFIFSSVVNAESNEDILKKGYEVYKAKCSACHIDRMDREKMMEIRKRVMSGEMPPIKAPPFSEVSARLKLFFKDEKSFKEFVKDYITNPSIEKGKCMPMAYRRFGVMPPIGKGLTEEEKEAVATWLYRAFNTKWKEFHKGRKCRMMN